MIKVLASYNYLSFGVSTLDPIFSVLLETGSKLLCGEVF